jgi:hypothetical protein
VYEQPFPDAGAAGVDATGGPLDLLDRNLLGEALGAVPATQDAPGLDADGGGDLAGGEDGA